MPISNYGASPEEWDHFSLILGLTQDLLPVVSNPNAKISSKSAIKDPGKIPSYYNGSNKVVGISEWTSKKSSLTDVASWSMRSDYGICVQTRTIRALDIDISDSEISAKIALFIAEKLGVLPMRKRPNSGKLLLAFLLPGEFSKRTVKVDGGMIEFLANGQQFVAVGTHPSGVRYDWYPEIPKDFPKITVKDFEFLWSELVKEFAIAAPTDGTLRNPKIEDVSDLKDDPVAQFLLDKNLVISRGKEKQLFIDCPWKSEHTSDSGYTETAYFPKGSRGYEQGHFRCLHAHCASRLDQDFLIETHFYENDFEDVSKSDSETKKQLRFECVPGGEYAARPSPEYIIKDVLPQARLAVLFGEAGAGKSFVALDMSMAIALGKPWNGYKSKPGRVVYICAEGAGGFAKRLKAYQTHNQCELPLDIIPDAPNLLLKEDAVDIIKSIGKADVVVIDTFAQATPGANENTAEDVGKALGHCNQIHKATGALIILVHHAGKDLSKGARGWSGLRAAADAEIEISRDGEQRFIKISKQKDGEDGSSWAFELEQVQLGITEGEDIASCVINMLGHADRIAKTKPLAKWSGHVVQVWDQLAVNKISVKDFVDAAVEAALAIEPDAAKRRAYIGRAVATLAIAGGIFVQDGDQLLAPAL